MNSKKISERHYFVDEAGDLTLFNKREKGYGIYYDRRNQLTKEKIIDSLQG